MNSLGDACNAWFLALPVDDRQCLKDHFEGQHIHDAMLADEARAEMENNIRDVLNLDDTDDLLGIVEVGRDKAVLWDLVKAYTGLSDQAEDRISQSAAPDQALTRELRFLSAR